MRQRNPSLFYLQVFSVSGKVIFEFMEPLSAGMDKKTFMTELENKIETKCNELNQETLENYPYTKSQMYKK